MNSPSNETSRHESMNTLASPSRPQWGKRVRGNVCWAGWASAVAMVLFVLLTSGCQPSDPVVPENIYEQVNSDGREWTYDTAWQNIRRLNADFERGELDTITGDALFIGSQMERLEKAKATGMTGSEVAKLIEQVNSEAASRSEDANVKAAKVAALRLQDAFDAGDFRAAKEAALEVYALSQRFSSSN